MNKIHLFLIGSVIVTSSLFAQTSEERQEIIRNYDLEKLNQLHEQFEAKYKAKKEEAVKYALKNNIDIVIKKEDGGGKVLQEVLDDGTLIYVETRNAGSAETSSTNELYNGGSLGLDLDGTGMEAGVWDFDEVRTTHQEFNGRVTLGQNTGTLSTHATHVTGTIGASGVDPNAKGMAPNVDLLSYNFQDGNDLAEMTQEAANGLLLSNHSYGIDASSIPESALGAYIPQSADLDNLLYNSPFYSVQFAAGNDRNAGINSSDGGFDLLTGTSLAKNAIVVANVNGVSNYTGPNSVSMSTSSSWGPPDDGRIKPDISTKGVSVFSPVSSSDTNYASLTGTSMAAPGVTGSLVLLQELNNQINGSFLRAATLRALMANSAREAGNAPGPDYRYGWGLMNSKGMAETIIDSGFSEKVLQNNANYTNSVQAVGANTPLKVTIAWQDLPGPIQGFNDEDNLTSRLVNDLDLRVTDSNGNVFQPWTLNNIVPSLPAQTGDNNTDNIEQVVIDDAVGDYTIEVSHKGTLQDAPQSYSIAVTGINGTLSNDDFAANKQSFDIYPNPAQDQITLEFSGISIPANKINIYDLSGKVVRSYDFDKQQSSKLNLNVSDISSGIYLVKTESPKGSDVEKLIIK